MEEKKRSAIIYIGGQMPSSNICTWHCDVCIAADAGVYACNALEQTPDMILGDFDSVTIDEARRMFPDAQIKVYDVYKDYTDTQLALLYACEQGCNDITIVGGEGGSIDHFIDLLFLFSRPYAPNRIIVREQQIELITHNFEIFLQKDEKISFFPVGNKATRQRSSGLMWNLDNYSFSYEQTSARNIAVSNEMIQVTMEEGKLIAVWQHHNTVQRGSLV